ncbi:MAG TPA: response regulator transcription factor [bacterium]|nr:response regulator transcription factor [bacterium]HPO11477.1 response regulator transcription factor [bacterium]
MKILIIDNDISFGLNLKNFLRKEGFNVDYFYNTIDGLSKVINERYDFIILELNLREISGIDVCFNIRSGGIKSPIIFLTNDDSISSKIKAFGAGCDDYISKQINFKELVLRIRAIARRPINIFCDEILKIEDLEINVNKHIVKRGDRIINLTNKEFMVLEYLARNNGNIVKRDEIFDNVWDCNSNQFNNIVEVYINKLRNKIDYGYSDKIINNIIGVGYYVGRKRLYA